MSIELRDYFDVLYTICCDSCGRYLREGRENSYLCAERDEAEKTAEEDGWILDGNAAYCPDCWWDFGIPI